MTSAFLIAALCAPPAGARGYQIDRGGTEVAVIRMISEAELEEQIKRHNPDIEEVFIHPFPQEDKLKEHFWIKLPFLWNDKQVWIKRKPVHDGPQKRALETSA